MLTATLGGLIKDYRIKKRLSQQELAMRIGWNDASRLSKIEQGRVSNPSREVLDKIITALDLDERGKTDILFACKILPLASDVQKMISEINKILGGFKYPLILVHYEWNISYMNMPARRVLQIDNKEYKYIAEHMPNWMEMLFIRGSLDHVEIKAGYTQDSLVPAYEYWIGHFKYEQAHNTEESWYRKLLTELNRMDHFKELWPIIKPSTGDHLFGYEVNEITGMWEGKKRTLRYHVTTISPTHDQRFFLLVHYPIDQQTLDFPHASY